MNPAQSPAEMQVWVSDDLHLCLLHEMEMFRDPLNALIYWMIESILSNCHPFGSNYLFWCFRTQHLLLLYTRNFVYFSLKMSLNMLLLLLLLFIVVCCCCSCCCCSSSCCSFCCCCCSCCCTHENDCWVDLLQRLLQMISTNRSF